MTTVRPRGTTVWPTGTTPATCPARSRTSPAYWSSSAPDRDCLDIGCGTGRNFETDRASGRSTVAGRLRD